MNCFTNKFEQIITSYNDKQIQQLLRVSSIPSFLLLMHMLSKNNQQNVLKNMSIEANKEMENHLNILKNGTKEEALDLLLSLNESTINDSFKQANT